MRVGPDYLPPDVHLPETWHADLNHGLDSGETDPQLLADWWKRLNDPILSHLIENAVENNLTTKEATSRVREARARRAVAKAGLFPTLDATGSTGWSRSNPDNGADITHESYSASFDAGWELDIFGGNRRSVEASNADFKGAEESLRDVLVSMTAEVALNYTDVRTYQFRLSIAEENLKIQQETYELTKYRYDAGLDDELAMHQATSSLETTKAQIPTLRTGLEAARNRIAVLLGKSPGAVNDELGSSSSIPVSPLEIAVGVPAETLKQRPDVRRAEWALIAQTARVGAATANLYPSLNLSGSIGLESLALDDFFSSATKVTSIASRITWPIFHAGAIRRNIEVQSALQEQALYQYEAAVLSALEEVENALVAYANEQKRQEALIASVEAAKQAVDLSKNKYSAGLSDFQVLLDTERSLLSAQDQMAQSKGLITSNLIRLYKALGGGWAPLPLSGNE